MPKLGKQFELVVSDVVREMDPNSVVRQGEWIEGPDGEREIDVIIEGSVDGLARRIQIECRDYNPEGRPIGIGHIDALDSKHRDLKMDVSLLCSNAGFTADAIRKAQRVGIGLIGILRENDPRIRYRVVDEIYIRRLNFVPNSLDVTFSFEGIVPPLAGTPFEDINYDGLPVLNWLKSRVLIFVSSNPIVKGVHSLHFRFKQTLCFNADPGIKLAVTGIRAQFSITGGWFAQMIEIDATSGIYDWIRQTIRVGPGPGRINYKDVKFGHGGTPINCPPGFDALKQKTLEAGEMSIWILDIGGLDTPKDIPQLNKFVVDEDLVPVRRDLADEAYYS